MDRENSYTTLTNKSDGTLAPPSKPATPHTRRHIQSQHAIADQNREAYFSLEEASTSQAAPQDEGRPISRDNSNTDSEQAQAAVTKPSKKLLGRNRYPFDVHCVTDIHRHFRHIVSQLPDLFPEKVKDRRLARSH